MIQPLPIHERMRIKRALLDRGVLAVGWAEWQLLAAYKALAPMAVKKCNPCKRSGEIYACKKEN